MVYVTRSFPVAQKKSLGAYATPEMSALETLKDPRSITSITAIVGVGVSWLHFRNEINALKQEQRALRDELDDLPDYAVGELKDAVFRIERRLTALETAKPKTIPAYRRVTPQRTVDDDLEEEINLMS